VSGSTRFLGHSVCSVVLFHIISYKRLWSYTRNKAHFRTL